MGPAIRIGSGRSSGLMRARGVAAVCASAAMVIASPAFAASWRSGTVTAPSGPPDAALTDVSCVSRTLCMAVGSSDYGFDRLGTSLLGPITTFAEQWDGSSWSALPSPTTGPNPVLVSISCVSPTFCVAVGATHTEGRQGIAGQGASRDSRALLEIWDGSAWRLRATPISTARSNALSGVSCTSSRFCTAVGSSGLVWNGRNWRRVALPSVRFGPTWIAISCVAAGECTAFGWYNPRSGGVAGLLPLAGRWHAVAGLCLDRRPSATVRWARCIPMTHG